MSSINNNNAHICALLADGARKILAGKRVRERKRKRSSGKGGGGSSRTQADAGAGAGAGAGAAAGAVVGAAVGAAVGAGVGLGATQAQAQVSAVNRLPVEMGEASTSMMAAGGDSSDECGEEEGRGSGGRGLMEPLLADACGT